MKVIREPQHYIRMTAFKAIFLVCPEIISQIEIRVALLYLIKLNDGE